MEHTSGQRLVELTVGRDQSSIDGFGECQVEAIVETVLRVPRELVGGRKQSIVGMSFERKERQPE